jgi:hypothetical protein
MRENLGGEGRGMSRRPRKEAGGVQVRESPRKWGRADACACCVPAGGNRPCVEGGHDCAPCLSATFSPCALRSHRHYFPCVLRPAAGAGEGV